MSKHFIEKPKKPACLQFQNICMVIAFVLIFLLFDPIFNFIFITAMVVFYCYDIYQFRHMPEAILYAKEGKLYYYKKILKEIPLIDIFECKVQRDKKSSKYIELNYNEDEFKKQILIKEANADEIVNQINKLINKAKNKNENQQKKNNQTKNKQN